MNFLRVVELFAALCSELDCSSGEHSPVRRMLSLVLVNLFLPFNCKFPIKYSLLKIKMYEVGGCCKAWLGFVMVHFPV